MKDQRAEISLDDTIGEVVQQGDPGAIVTGWAISVSVKHQNMPKGDGYVYLHSEALPHHSQIGLLQTALDDKRNTILVNTLLEAGRG